MSIDIRPMRILLVCNKSPFPSTDGGTLAMAGMLESFHRLGYEVEAVVYDTYKHPFTLSKVPAHLHTTINWHPIPVNNRKYPLAAFRHLLQGRSYILHRFHTPAVADYLEGLLHDHVFDVIHLDSLFTLPYLEAMRMQTEAPIIYRAHNIEHKIWQALHGNLPLLQRWYLHRETQLLAKAEWHLAGQADAIVAISPQDKDWLTTNFPHIPVATIPFALDLPANDRQEPPNDEVFHLGAMDWMPNQDAIKWLLEAVWPGVCATVPTAKLYLAGRHMPPALLATQQQGVMVSGMVDDAQRFQMEHGIMVVPLHAGSGLRVKIIEGMALGRAIVTTSSGIAGIPATHGKEVWIADSAADMQEALITLIRDPQRRQALGKAAQAFCTNRYSLDAVGQQIDTLYRKVMAK